MQWLAEHEAEYAGQWLALDGDCLLSHGEDPHKVRAEARAMGVETPFVVFADSDWSIAQANLIRVTATIRFSVVEHREITALISRSNSGRKSFDSISEA